MAGKESEEMKHRSDQSGTAVRRPGGSTSRLRLPVSTLVATLAVLLAVLPAASSSAAIPQQFWQYPQDGKSDHVRGNIAVDQQSGDIYVAEFERNQVREFSPWGTLIKSFGWGVVASGPDNQSPKNEGQKLTVSATSGTYELTYNETFHFTGDQTQTTAPIPYDASAGEVQAALEALEGIEPGDLAVSGGPGDEGGTSPYTIEFEGRAADANVLELEAVGSTLAGGAASATVETTQEGGSYEICVPASGDVCQQHGQFGFTPGGFTNPGIGGIAVDGEGNLYVREASSGGGFENYRVQKFDSEGHFLAMWGGEVNKTKSAEAGSTEAERNLCTLAEVEAGEECGRGIPGSGQGQLDAEGLGLAIGPTGNVFAGGNERIEEFDPEGHYLGAVAIPGEQIRGVAVDHAGNLYVAYNGKDNLRKLSPAGAELGSFAAEKPEATGLNSVALSSTGDVYLVENPFTGLGAPRILAYHPSGTCFICKGDQLTVEGGPALSSACGVTNDTLYTTVRDAGEEVLRAYGATPDPDLCPPPAVAPQITDQYALTVNPDSAVVRAGINPNFWTDTRYYVQYGTGKCSEGGCERSQPLAPGSLLTGKVTNASVQTGSIFLTGLHPGTTYHFRFVAESSGGGPVRGVGGTEATDGAEADFTTFPEVSLPTTECANRTLRTGPSAALPDCRAYEMVSPVDKQNGDVVAFTAADGAYAALNQSSADGEKLAYSTFRPYGDAPSGPITSQYIAARGAGGWSSHAISPPLGAPLTGTVSNINNQFKAFSPDLCTGWLFDESDLRLDAGAVQGFANLYRRQNCGVEAGSYAALTTAEPPSSPPDLFFPELKGVSADGSRALLVAGDALTEGAPTPALNAKMLYESFGNGKLRFVCVLPSGLPVGPNGCMAGTAAPAGFGYGRSAAVHHAISENGSRVFWSDSSFGQGHLYVRINGKTTHQIGSETAQYWTAAASGSKAIYSTGSLEEGKASLDEYDVEAEESHQIAAKVYGVVGASEDAGRIYFVSAEALEAGASEGQPNLYLDEGGAGGTVHFIGVLAKGDIAATSAVGESLVSATPRLHTARVSPDGESVLFMSKGSPTGYDNTDALTGEADTEAYLYDAETEALHCVSCNPTGARPVGGELVNGQNEFHGAAQLPTEQTELYAAPRVLSEDGKRAYFESLEALVPSDTNGVQDVYQWEAPGSGECTEASPAYAAPDGGCISLISSGESPTPSEITDVSPDGNDVFFATAASLLPQDTGLIDIYDARTEGGFAQPLKVAACEGEACQGPYVPPNDPTPSSSAYQGPGNPKQPPPAARKKKASNKHAQGKRHHSKHKRKRRANRERRAGR